MVFAEGNAFLCLSSSRISDLRQAINFLAPIVENDPEPSNVKQIPEKARPAQDEDGQVEEEITEEFIAEPDESGEAVEADEAVKADEAVDGGQEDEAGDGKTKNVARLHRLGEPWCVTDHGLEGLSANGGLGFRNGLS